MSFPHLLLKYTVVGDSRIHVRGAIRIKVDGCGALTVYGMEGDRSEKVQLERIRALSIQSIPAQSSFAISAVQ